MRSLLFAATVLSVALYPAVSLRAEQAVPVVTAPVTLVSATDPAAASVAPGGELTRLTVKDGDGTLRTLLCQPLSVEKAPPVQKRVVPSGVARALPASPSPATVPVSRPGFVTTQPCPPPPRSTDMNIAPDAPLYAAPAAVAAAWNCYAPRQMAYAPRAWHAPDPAVHSPLPPLRSAARPAVRKRAPAKAPVCIGVDVLVSTIQTLCPPAVSSGRGAGVIPPNLPAPRVDAASAAPATAASRDIYGGPAPSVSATPPNPAAH